MFMSFSKNKIHAFVAKLGNRCFCWFPSVMLELIQVNNSMASLYYLNLYKWVKHFFRYLVYEIFLWPESWRGPLYMYLLSFPRFWTLSIERFWFLFWSILNGVTLKISNTRALFNFFRNVMNYSNFWKIDWTLFDWISEYCLEGAHLHQPTHAHIYIARAEAVTDSCLAFLGAHKHGIAKAKQSTT